MAIRFAGTSIADLTLNSTAWESTDTGQFNNARVKEGISVSSTGLKNTIKWSTKMTEGWLSFCSYCGSNSSSSPNTFVGLMDSSYSLSNEVLKITGVNQCYMQYYTGSAFTTIQDLGTNFFLTGGGVIVKWDIHWKIADTGGYFRLYKNGILVADPSLDDSLRVATTGIDTVNFASGGNATVIYSEIIVADEDTRAMQLHQVLPNANGDVTDWTGDYTAVDEKGYSDTDFITTSVNGAKEIYKFPDFSSTIANWKLSALVLAARVQGGSVAPNKVKGVMRIGGTDYEKDPEIATEAPYGPQQVIFSNNPATSALFVGSDLANLQLGFKATS